ncbi:MAG: ABC-F family ATP-binding cassette domain-containing protein [Bernardetiaceae bacterium]|nr:ABC-F family ATP-binding cassette domain-containing protein [Bernardetiaceae bacterium]
MLSINDLSYFLGSRALYQNTSLHIKPKDRIGLIGANGTGKSTLLRLITGEYTPDEGSISKSGDCTIGFLNQDLLSYQTDDSILAVAMEAFERQNAIQHRMDELLKKMETDYDDSLVDKLTTLQEEFMMLDGYSLQAKAEEILEGLGFATEDLHRPLRLFSGGWRMRVMLAKMLLMKPSLLMLDEPTNHLDLPSIQWLENYLRAYEGAIIVVSHDRQFLDNVSNVIVEVAQQKLNYYAGNYSFFLEEKALRTEIQNGAYENQQQAIRQAERFIERFKAKATKARQVQSRVKALNRMDLVEEVVDENARVNFRFTFDQQPGRYITQLEHVSKAFGPLELLRDTNVAVERGDKIALIGANGRGKSTLLRIIQGSEPIQTGEVRGGYNVRSAMYAQHQLEALHLDNTILEEMKQAGTTKTEAELRAILGCFLFSGDDVFKKIKVLSGGEKSRVSLALTLISKSNFLLLDGSFVVISHDRHFVSQIANKIWWIEDRAIREYLGSYDEFVYWQAKNNGPADQKMEKRANLSKEKKENRPAKSLEETEAKITALEQEKKELEYELGQPGVYQHPPALGELQRKLAKVEGELKTHNAAWEKLAEEVENLEEGQL